MLLHTNVCFCAFDSNPKCLNSFLEFINLPACGPILSMEWLAPRVVNLTVPFLRCFLNFVPCPTANVCNICSPTFLFCVQSVGKLLHSVCFAPQCYISMHHAKEDLSLQCVKKAP